MDFHTFSRASKPSVFLRVEHAQWKSLNENSYFCYKYLKYSFCGRIVVVSGRAHLSISGSVPILVRKYFI
jgi:hypothetical protein